MKIKDLPQNIQHRVFVLQIAAGNKPNSELELIAKKSQGNFDWDKSDEDWRFWAEIDARNYNVFMALYPHGVPDPRPDRKKQAHEITTSVIKDCRFTMSEGNWEELERLIELHVKKVIGD